MTNTETVDAELPEFFVEGTTVRVRVQSAFGDADTMYCTMGDWHADQAQRVADALNTASRTQSPAEWQVEMQKLVDYFRGEGFTQFGNEGDFEGWTPAETAINAMRELAALRAASIPAPERSKEETSFGVDVAEDEVRKLLRSKEETVEVKVSSLLAIRDALAADNLNEAWHELYTIADPDFCEMEPWRNLEHKAALETPPLHKEGEAVYFADGNTVRKRVGSAFGEGDVLFCTPSAWFQANEVADLLNAAPAPVPVTITEQADYLVWSNEHRAWWRANSQGYSRSILDAGRYTRAEAVDIADKSRNGWKLDQRPDEIAVAIADLPPPIRAALSAKPGEQG